MTGNNNNNNYLLLDIVQINIYQKINDHMCIVIKTN